jgi:TrmH family RNA methyltransferase
MITELSRSLAKDFARLQQKKYRVATEQFIIEGPKMIEEALQQSRFPIRAIIGTAEFLQQFQTPNKNIVFYSVTPRELKKISGMKTPQDGLAVLQSKSMEAPQGNLLLFLNELQNPGNMGTIFRSAEWLGADGILIGSDSSEPFNPKVVQASMGSIFRLPFYDCSLASLKNYAQSYDILGADIGGRPIKECDTSKPSIIVIGNEGRGITPDVQEIIQQTISIPQTSGGQAESLNAAISAAIITYEWNR